MPGVGAIWSSNESRSAMRAFAQKPEATRGTTSATPVMLRRADSVPGGASGAILRLQRVVGNRAVRHHVHVHSANAGSRRPDIQRASLNDLAGKPTRQSFVINDDEIEATDEFKKYMNASSVWQTKDKVTKQEAFLACRLIIEALQRGQAVKWESDARGFMDTARKLIKITKSPKADCPSSKYKACVKRADMPGGLMNLAAIYGVVTGFFTMEIDWHEDDPGCACCCGEYRQFVKGFIKVNGTKQKKTLFNGNLLSDKTWNEDSDDKNHAYGHRDSSEAVNDKFIPDRKNGCLYRGFDTPGITDVAVAGKRVDAFLEFKGQAFDRCQNTAGSERSWKLEFHDDVPALNKDSGALG
jgi:hypothetical protein